jgi:hypothetical protein
VQDGRIHIEKINWPMLSEHKATPAEYKAGVDLAIQPGLLWLHESAPTSGSPRQVRSCSREPYVAILVVASASNRHLPSRGQCI